MRKLSHIAVFSSLVVVLLASGCGRGSYLWVQHKKFRPRLPTYLQTAYRGRAIHLKAFVNQTSSRYYYYSPDRTVTYEGSPSLEGYTRHCFRKALTQFMGMRVVKRPDPSVPSLQVTLQRWDSQRMVASVTLLRGNRPVLRRQYAVVNPAPASTQKSHLEASAFYQMSLLIARVFMDRKFFMAYYRRAGGAATYRAPADQPPGAKGGQPGPAPAPGPGGAPAPGPGPGSAPPPAPGHKGPAHPDSGSPSPAPPAKRPAPVTF